MAEPTRHVQRPAAVQGGLTHCACGNPWPCGHSAEGRLAALREQVQRARDIVYEQACDHSELPGHEFRAERDFARVAAYDDVLKMLAPEGER